MPELTHSPDAATLVNEATQRLTRTVDSHPDEGWTGPSLLPDWTRAHVLAHLTLNAEGVAGALGGIVAEGPLPMYASQEARDGDIEELAQATPEELRNRYLASVTAFDDAVAAVPEDAWETVLERTPGGRTFPARATLDMRLREVEIHHVDLAAGPTHHDWTPAFCTLLLEGMTMRDLPAMTVRPTDLDRDWQYAGGGPIVSGTAADLGWWLTGRGAGEGLTCDAGELPTIGAM